MADAWYFDVQINTKDWNEFGKSWGINYSRKGSNTSTLVSNWRIFWNNSQRRCCGKCTKDEKYTFETKKKNRNEKIRKSGISTF